MKFLRDEQGYSLAEAIVAIGILSSALLGTVALAVQSIRVSDIAESKLQAEYLAQEGIELVRAMREDRNGFFKEGVTATSYDTIVSGIAMNGSKTINIDSEGHVCGDATSCPLSQLFLYKDIDDGSFLAIQKTLLDQRSKFQREVKLSKKQNESGVAYIEVSSKVIFTLRGVGRDSSYTVTTNLYDWQN